MVSISISQKSCNKTGTNYVSQIIDIDIRSISKTSKSGSSTSRGTFNHHSDRGQVIAKELLFKSFPAIYKLFHHRRQLGTTGSPNKQTKTSVSPTIRSGLVGKTEVVNFLPINGVVFLCLYKITNEFIRWLFNPNTSFLNGLNALKKPMLFTKFATVSIFSMYSFRDGCFANTECICSSSHFPFIWQIISHNSNLLFLRYRFLRSCHFFSQ